MSIGLRVNIQRDNCTRGIFFSWKWASGHRDHGFMCQHLCICIMFGMSKCVPETVLVFEEKWIWIFLKWEIQRGVWTSILCLWDIPSALLLIKPKKGNISNGIYGVGSERLLSSECALDQYATSRSHLMCCLSHILKLGGNTSSSLKLHYISEAKNMQLILFFSNTSFFIIYLYINLCVFMGSTNHSLFPPEFIGKNKRQNNS